MLRTLFCRFAQLLNGLVFLLAPSITAAQDSLAWRFKEGEKLAYQRTQDRKHATNRPDQGEVIRTELRVTDLTVKFNKVQADGSAELTVTIERIQQKQKGPRGVIEYDSAAQKKPDGDAA
jgi:hypothetical protein